MDLAQRTGILSAPILRPLATSMFFLALVVLGSIAVQRMPIALLPDLEGDVLFVNFNRPGSDPDFIERELLNPLESRARSLPDVVEMLGQINGSGGSLTLEFEPGTDIKVRLNELTQIASKLEREQPLGTTFISASSQGTSGSQNFVLNLAVYGGTNDPDVLFDLATEHVAPRLAAAPGVSRAMISGGSGKQVTVIADPARGAILGVTTSEVTDAVERTVGRPDYLGNVEDSQGQTDIILDGRVSNIQTLANAQIKRDSPAQIRHVGEVEIGYGRHTTAFRVNGEAAVGISVFQEQGANLLMVAKALNEEIAEVRTEVQSLGLELVVLQDGAEVVEKQVDRLMKLSLIGFVIALAVLFLFLRQWRAVVVVGISVPVSVVLALASLYLLGYGINLVTLFGLAVSVGLLVDNSVVVYEAILRSIERGAAPEVAVRNGLKRTVRAIIAASVTTAIVFLPLYLVDLDNTFLEEFSKVIAAGLLLPLFASLLVAVGLVPLLAHRLAAPAAVRRVAQDRIKRAQRAGILAPDRLRLLLTGFSRLALRHPPSWLTGTAFAIVVTLFLVPPWVFGTRSSDSETIADSVELVVVFNRGTRGLDATSTVVKQLEDELSQIPGVDRVVANVSEDQGELTVFFVDEEQRPDDLTVGSVRNRANQIGDSMPGVDVRRPGEEEYKSRRGGRGGASFFGGAANEVVISGPDSRKLMDLGEQIREQLRNTQYIDRAWLRVQRGNAELVVSPNRDMFESLGLRLIQIFPVLNLAGNEGSRVASNFSMSSGREIPIFVERTGARDTEESLSQLRRIKVPTASGLNVTLNDLATTRVMQPPATIVHRNGRREMKVGYRLSNELPDSGPTREAAVEQISEIIRMVPRPTGYSVEIEDPDDYVSTISKIAIPVLLFLYLVLAITFESLSLPLLVMLAIPLTMLGSLWALFLTGKGLDPGVLVGFVALFGITVNPAILLVDRMQRRQLDAKWSAGAAAFASVSERTRPILLTTATTIAALIPLSITPVIKTRFGLDLQ